VIEEEPPTTLLPSDWYTYRLAEGVRENLPGLYEWHIEGVGSYIGKYTHIDRPKKHYSCNVFNLLNGRDYRPKKPDGFRNIHRKLKAARDDGKVITLTILENVPRSQLTRREHELIVDRGSLNVSPFGKRSSD
jgi:hypothetical protein